MKFIKKVPLAISCLSLALAALGNLLLPRSEALRLVCGVFSLLLLCTFFLKVICDRKQVKEELQNPAVFSILPTATMSLMLLAAYARPYLNFAVILWFAAVFVHLIIMLCFFRVFLADFTIGSVFPSWFIICSGIAAASITSPAMGMKTVGQVLFYPAFFLYLAAFPLVVFRLVKSGPLPEPAQPFLAIFTAPVSLCLAGYLSAFERPDKVLVSVMTAITVMSYLYVLGNLPFLLRLKFYPAYAAFTFPCVITAIALKSAGAFLADSAPAALLPAARISEWIAVLIVIYVSVRYLIFFASKPAGSSTETSRRKHMPSTSYRIQRRKG